MTVAGGTYLDPRTEAFVADVLAAIDFHVAVVEAFLVGSGAAGGFDPKTSDVDLVVVVEQLSGADKAAVVERVAALERPVRDLELVVYAQGLQPPEFALNVNEGEERPDEERFWFVLDAAVAQDRAMPVWGRRPWSEFFAPIPPERVREAMQESLDWSERQAADNEFARAQAVRARRYLERGEWITKKEAKE
jgi:predicted nucleotidyltransferase